MIITRTPFRISFCGGGSDLKEYYLKYGGAVLSAGINKYVFLSLHPFFYGNKYFLKYSKSELVDHVDKIQHRIIRQVLKDYGINGVDFNSSADIPAGTGLGSSSAFTVGLINLCNAYIGKYMNKEEIAHLACETEIDKLGEPIGKQDQYICAVGGLNYISFHRDDSVTVEKVYIDHAKRIYLEKNLLMFYTGITRSASEILAEQKNNTCMDKSKIENLHKMVKLAGELKNELLRGNIDTLAEILHAGWMYKRELASGISNEQINHYYDIAIKNGASGGKLLGAGGGGFLLFYVKEDYQDRVRKALSDLKELEFHFDYAGTGIIYYDK
jgi:D-glycero-alpha-D-manno-heptose-7-phosphate kinase